MIDKLTIRKILDTASIVDVVEEFYQLRKRGTEFECLCPFHKDRHLGSFKISPRKNIAHCFSCDWQGGPVDFVIEHEHLSFPDAIRWLGKKYNIDTDMPDFNYTPHVTRPTPPPLPMLVLPNWMVRVRQHNEHNTLVQWIRSLNWSGAQEARVEQMLRDYRIGTARNGMTIFWQIDEQQRVRTGKMMLYKQDGHRDKEINYNFDWVHSSLYRDYRTGYSADKTDMKSCLFGLHLLDHYKVPGIQQDVCIVESEKTALLMAIAYGNHNKQVWMACGGQGNINGEKLRPLMAQHRNIILYPDRDSIQQWKERAEGLHYHRLSINTEAVKKWWVESDGPKADIADVVLRLIGQKKIYRTVEEVVEDIPLIQQLHEQHNLSINNPNDQAGQ